MIELYAFTVLDLVRWVLIALLTALLCELVWRLVQVVRRWWAR